MGIARRAVAGVALLGLLAAQIAVAPLASAMTFPDVPADHFAAGYISDLVSWGVMSGNDDGTFRPNAFLNRAEMAKVAVKLAKVTGVIADENDMTGAPRFSDVASDTWYYGYVSVAAKNAMFEGYKDANGNLTGRFGPGDMVTRAQAAKVLLKAAGVPEKLSPAAPFVDVNPGDWFYGYVTTAYNWSVLDGYKDANGNLTGYFGPNDYVTRGQIAKIAVKAKSPTDRVTGLPPSNTNSTPSNTNNTNSVSNTNSANNNVNSVVPPSKVAFEAAVSPSSPAGGTLATGTAFNTVAKLDLTAGSDEDVKVTEMTIIHRGITADSIINGVMVLDKDGMRHGNIVSFADSKATINMSANPIIVKAGTTHTATIQVNFSTDSSFNSGTFGVEIASGGITAMGVTSGGAVTVKGTYPLVWSVFPVVAGSNIGDVQVDVQTITTSNVEVDLGEKNREVTRFAFVQNNGKEDVKLHKLTLFNNGNTSDTDIANIRLLSPTNQVLATAEHTSNRYVTFDLTASPYLITKGATRNLSVMVDIAPNSNGSTRTIQFVISNDYDVMIKGETSNAYLLPTARGTVDTSFPIGDASGINTLVIKEGTLTLSKASTSASGEVSAGANDVTIAEFTVEAAGEDIEIQGGTFNVVASGTVTTSGSESVPDLKGTLKITNADGSTLHSVTVSDTANNHFFDGSNAAADAVSRFNNFYTVKAGTKGSVKFVVSIADNAAQNNTLKAQLKDLVIKKLSSNRTTTLSTSTEGNTITITTASLSVASNSAMGAQNVVKGVTEKKIGSVNLTSTNAEAVAISSAVLGFENCAGSSTVDPTGITNLRIKKGTTQLGSTISTPSTASNSFSITGVTVEKSSTVSLDVYADVTTAFAGSEFSILIDQNKITGVGTLSSKTIQAPAASGGINLQCNTIVSSGSLTASKNSSTTQSTVLAAGTTGVSLFSFDLAASNNEDMNVKRVKVAVGNGATTVSKLKLFNGSTQVAGGTDGVTLSNGVAEFSGFELLVPINETRTLTVKGDINMAGSLDSDTELLGGLYFYEANGASSGQLVQRYAGTELIATDGSENYDKGTPVVAFVGSAAGLGVVETAGAGSGTTLMVATTHQSATFIPPAASRLSVLPATATATGTAVNSMKAVVGDLLVIATDTTANSSSNNQVRQVSAVSSGAVASLNGSAYTAGANAIAAKLPVKAIEAYGTTTATQHDYAVGEVVYGKIQGTYTWGIVTTAGKLASGAMFLTSGGTSVAATTGDVVSTLPIISSETGITSTGIASGSYAPGDVVVFAAGTTSAPALGIVTAVSSTNVLTIAATDGSAAVASTTFTAGYVSKLFSARANGNTMVVEDTVPELAVSGSTPTGARSPSTEQEIGRFTINASGTRDLTVKTMNFKVDGSYATAGSGGYVSNFKIYTDSVAGTPKALGTSNGSTGTCADKTGVLADSTDCGTAIAFDFGSGFKITQNTQVTFIVTADTNNIGVDGSGQRQLSLTLQLPGTGASRDVNNSLIYTYTNTKTPTSVTVITDYVNKYPFTLGTLTYSF